MRRGVLLLLSLTLLACGLAFLADPIAMTSIAELQLAAPAAITDVRATYGGFQAGAAIFLLICAARRDLLPVGLHAAGWIYLGFGAGRSMGLLIDRPEGSLMPIIAIVELTAAALAFWAARATFPWKPAHDPAIAKRAA